MSLSLYRKYRPRTFSDVIGQIHIVRTLKNSIKNNRVGHAYLFTGPRGTGKTTLARIFAKSVNCLELSEKTGFEPCEKCLSCENIGRGQSMDIIEIDAASNTGVDNIRDLREAVKLPPTISKYKVYIIDEVHMLSGGAFNALLKTLEEPPAHVIFILATTEIHKIPETILSRCQRFDFTKLTLPFIIEKLSKIAKGEGVKIEKAALEMIAIAAEGGMRDAESLLAQIISLEDKNITIKETEELLGSADRELVKKLMDAIIRKDPAEGLRIIRETADGGYNLEIFIKSVLDYQRKLLILNTDENLAEFFRSEASEEEISLWVKNSKLVKTADLLLAIEYFSASRQNIKSSFIPQLPIEIALIKSCGNFHAPIVQEIAPLSPVSQITPKENPPFAKSEPTLDPELSQAQPNEKVKTEEAETKSENAAPIELGQVKSCWNQFLQEMKPVNHSLHAFLINCYPARAKGSTVHIACKFALYKDKFNELQNQLTMEKILGNILGCKLKILAQTEEEMGIKRLEPLDNEPIETPEKPSETASLLSDALSILGGKIVE